jgi:phage-related protein
MILPDGYNYPISVTCKAEPMVTGFGEGYQQRSGYEPLRTVQLNYLGLSNTAVNNLVQSIDAAGGVDNFDWLYRPHYANYKWRINRSRMMLYDLDRVQELTLDLKQYPTGVLLHTLPIEPVLLNIVPDQAPSFDRTYRTNQSNLGYFFDARREPVNPIIESISFTVTCIHAVADEIDLLLDRCRGVYPLLWRGKTYVCADWTVIYMTECAEVSIVLQTVNVLVAN